ncbi:cupin-like domain-containing protein [Moheibacter sp.]|uniref:cupin-like domain-containing protein n=1 Tax=Moheibacter sp. TaxID=1965316 RepID=UPI003C76BC93
MGKFNLAPVDRVKGISKEEFVKNYLKKKRPVLIEGLTDSWNDKWRFDYIKKIAGDQMVPLYNNEPTKGNKSSYEPVTHMKMREYLDKLQNNEPTDLRIFFYMVKDNLPQLEKDFEYPDIGMNYFKRIPALFFGGSKAHTFMHYDIDLGDNLHIHFEGHKRVLLFGPEQNTNLYKVPMSICNIESIDMNNPDFEKYPALEKAQGFEAHMHHGDALYIPGEWWHFISYMNGGFSMSLRALPQDPIRFLGMMYNIFFMRHLDYYIRKFRGQKWIDYKEKWAYRRTHRKLGIKI